MSHLHLNIPSSFENNSNFCALEDFYLGFALSLQKDGPGSRTQETIHCLQEAMEALLAQNTTESLTSEER